MKLLLIITLLAILPKISHAQLNSGLGNGEVGAEQKAATTAATAEADEVLRGLGTAMQSVINLNNSCNITVQKVEGDCTNWRYQQISGGVALPIPVSTAEMTTCGTQLISAINQARTHISTAGNSCVKVGKRTQISCEASTYAPYVGLVTGQLAGSSSGSMYDKCKKAATLQLGMSTISAGLAGTCYFSKRSCETSCAKIDQEMSAAETKIQQAIGVLRQGQSALSKCSVQGVDLSAVDAASTAYNTATQKVRDAIVSCEKYELNVMSALLSATQLIQGIAQSQSCQKELAQEDCMKPEAVNNPACTAAYCSNQANQSAPQCAAMFGECFSANAAANPRCACLQNPMQQSCLNLPTVDTNTATRNNASSSTEGFNFDEDDLYGDQGDNLGFGDPNSKAPGVVGGGQQGGGGGGSGQGSALGGGPSGGGSGAQKGVYDTNVTGGTSAGAVGGGGSGGISGYNGNTGGGYGSGLPGSGIGGPKNSLDLKKYLPGGQLAKQRDEADMGITPANGLTNFQKVNRAHNKSRTNLVTP